MAQEAKGNSVQLATVVAMFIAGIVQPAIAATLCVGAGKAGCYSTIGAAVLAAAPGDTVQVAQGTYKEGVIIGKSLSLIGKNSANTIVDATGQANGVYVDGLDNPSLNHVVVAGFTVANANFEGILVTNASGVTIRGNHVTSNNRSLDVVNLVCPGIPIFETNEGFDCGEGVHIIGVDHSTLANNLIENNAGGILITDETGATHDNLIMNNVAQNNPFDCGITIPSHPRAPDFGPGPPFGIYSNTISGNEVSHNGVLGEGAGIGMFAFLPGARVSDNLIAGNRITGNGLPGVAMHAHSPGENLNNNVITGNYISGNGEDSEDAATPGPTGINVYGASPITGTVISQNVIKDEVVDIAASTPAIVEAHHNNLNGTRAGVANLGPGSVDATNNWWGCAHGPNTPGCSTVEPNVSFAPWLSSPAVPNGAP
jgi:nitrous oxidase accessory protein NosD